MGVKLVFQNCLRTLLECCKREEDDDVVATTVSIWVSCTHCYLSSLSVIQLNPNFLALFIDFFLSVASLLLSHL